MTVNIFSEPNNFRKPIKGSRYFNCFKFLFFCFIIFFKDFIYLRERGHETGGGTEGEGEAGSPLSREPNVESWDHDLSWRQMLNQLNHPSAPWPRIFIKVLIVIAKSPFNILHQSLIKMLTFSYIASMRPSNWCLWIQPRQTLHWCCNVHFFNNKLCWTFFFICL